MEILCPVPSVRNGERIDIVRSRQGRRERERTRLTRQAPVLGNGPIGKDIDGRCC